MSPTKHQILLINPAINSASQNKIINSVINTTFPTSLGVLAAYLKSKGIGPTQVVDEQLHFIDDAKLSEMVLAVEEPRVIGLSVLTINSKRSYELAKKIKTIDPHSTIVVGGIHPTVVPEEALKVEAVDAVVLGEGEETFHELVECVKQGKPFDDIRGIALRRNERNIFNPPRPLINDLDQIPAFPYEMFEADREKYPTFGSVITSRGCPYNCFFCSSRSVSGKRYRYFGVARVVAEIRRLVDEYQQKTIWMMDDNIASHRQHFLELLDAIIRENFPPDVHFHGSMRGDNVTDEILDKAKLANFKMISFGLETGNESLMALIDKGETVAQVADAIRKTSAKGINVATTIIFGLPGETKKDRQEAIDLVRSLPLASVRFNILTPYPGTPAYDMLKSLGQTVELKDWQNFAVQYMWEGDDLPYVPQGNNVYELMVETMLANLSFYFSVGGIRRMLKSSFAGGNVINVSKKRLLSVGVLWSFVRVLMYLGRRFMWLYLKMLAHKIKMPRHKKYAAVKDLLEDIIRVFASEKVKTFPPEQRQLWHRYVRKTFANVLYERYRDFARPLYTFLPFHYQRVPAWLRYYLQKIYGRGNPGKAVFPSWPAETLLEEVRGRALAEDLMKNDPLFQRPTWPGQKNYALVLTHDVEAANNWRWVKPIAEAEKDMGLRSAWNVVPNFYRIDDDVLAWLAANGFEIGLQGYNHDNRFPFLGEKEMHRRIEASMSFITKYRVRGFRSPSWLRNEALFKVLQEYFDYDCSVPDVDYISPSGVGGCCAIFPYRHGRLVEIPTTIPYEFPLQCSVGIDGLNHFWAEKVDWIKRKGGAVVVNTHPDPFYSGTTRMVQKYTEFLAGFKDDPSCAFLLPSEVAGLMDGENDKGDI